ncbi:MAG: hypothetical protein Q4F40_07415 [Akkermansia sp.]|nr:hypothetical protein [Akkermansia sp.]
MISLSVNIEGDARISLLAPKDLQHLTRHAATKVQQAVKENFESLPGERFYKDAADATRLEMQGDAALISVEHRGVRLRWKGGSVVPGKGASSHTGKPTRLLAIPAAKRMEAPGRYKPLAFIPIKKRPHLKGLLMEGEQKTATRKHKGKPAGRAIIVPKPNGQLMFRLVDETEHSPNPRVMPTVEVLSEVAGATVRRTLPLLLRKKN